MIHFDFVNQESNIASYYRQAKITNHIMVFKHTLKGKEKNALKGNNSKPSKLDMTIESSKSHPFCHPK